MTTTIIPTLNADYDATRAQWAKTGYASDPTCEECGADLAGKRVHETAVMWVGDCCVRQANQDYAEAGRISRGERAAERSMGC